MGERKGAEDEVVTNKEDMDREETPHGIRDSKRVMVVDLVMVAHGEKVIHFKTCHCRNAA